MLHVGMGGSRLRVVFEIVKNVAVVLLLETWFTEKCVSVSFPTERKVVPFNSQSVLRLVVTEASNDSETTTKTTDIPEGSILAVKTEE